MIEDSFTDTVSISRSSPTFSGGDGQIVGPYYPVSSGVSCRIVPLSGRTGQTILGMYPDASHMMYASAGTNVKPSDKIVDANGVKYVVISVSKFKDETAIHHLECVLAELAVTA